MERKANSEKIKSQLLQKTNLEEEGKQIESGNENEYEPSARSSFIESQLLALDQSQ